MSVSKVAALAFLLSTAAASAGAVEISLPAASSFGAASGYQYNQTFNGLGGSVGHSDIFNTISASTTGLPDFRVQIAGSTTSQGSAAYADAHAKYYFVLLSAFPTEVHMLIDAVSQVSGAGTWYAHGQVGIHAKDGTLNQSLAYTEACNNIGNLDCYVTSNVYNDGGKVAVTLDANKIYSINLDVLGYILAPDSAFTAFADPVMSFDPDYDAPQGITFQFSDNLPPEVTSRLYIPLTDTDDGGGTVGGVPEPATWAMMLMGFAGLGALLRRQRQQARWPAGRSGA